MHSASVRRSRGFKPKALPLVVSFSVIGLTRQGFRRLFTPPTLARAPQVPPGTDGVALLRMNARVLTELVEEGGRAGRNAGQDVGADMAWTMLSGAKVGRELYSALRDAQRDAPIR